MNKAIFLDRDGTINYEKNYLGNIDGLRLFPNCAKAIKKANNALFKIVVISNQAGIARGYFTEKETEKINNEIIKRLKRNNAKIDGFYYCPHHYEKGIGKYKIKCSCRKPGIGLVLQAQKDFNINLEKSYFIGDRLTDILAGINAGCKTILVLTGYGKNELNLINENSKPDYIVKNLYEGINLVIKNEQI